MKILQFLKRLNFLMINIKKIKNGKINMTSKIVIINGYKKPVLYE